MIGKNKWSCIGIVLLTWLWHQPLAAAESKYGNYFEESEDNGISDPLEPLNRGFFEFNDRMYFWVIKPAAQVFDTFIPGDFRICFRNAFSNLMSPTRIVNNLLQGKIKDTGIETIRFLFNSTAGIGGMGDAAKDVLHLPTHEEDLGQTLGAYGVGEGVYICWPFLGPSNLRDTFGLIGDSFLNGATYLGDGNVYSTIGIKTGERINATSLTLGDYESFKESTVDPYVSMRNAYHQYRQKLIEE